MRKHYILDTNVLLHDPNSILSFQDNEVVIPIYVIEEVDHFKRQQTELGQNARRVSRLLDAFRQKGNLSQGVADQRRPIHFLPLCQTLGGSQKLCIEHDLYGFHMRTSFHSIVNMSSFPQFLIQEPVQLKVGRRSGLGTRCVNISVAPETR